MITRALLKFQELTQNEENVLSQTIADEHAKQLHWKESLKIEAQQLKAAKARRFSDNEAKQKQAVLDRKTKADLQLSLEDSRRKAAMDDLSQSIGSGNIQLAIESVGKTLSEFLSKC